MTAKAMRLEWLLNRFVKETPGVRHVQAVSADGIHLVGSTDLDRTQAETFAAITAGLASLCQSAGDVFDMKPVVRQVVETGDGWILVARMSSSASLAVATLREADLGLVGYEMTVLSELAGELLSPDLITTLKNPLDA